MPHFNIQLAMLQSVTRNLCVCVLGADDKVSMDRILFIDLYYMLKLILCVCALCLIYFRSFCLFYYSTLTMSTY